MIWHKILLYFSGFFSNKTFSTSVYSSQFIFFERKIYFNRIDTKKKRKNMLKFSIEHVSFVLLIIIALNLINQSNANQNIADRQAQKQIAVVNEKSKNYLRLSMYFRFVKHFIQKYSYFYFDNINKDRDCSPIWALPT